MVSSCPSDSSQFLAERCLKTVPAEEYLYLMDVPVVSESTRLVYANIFCAKCHKDKQIQKYEKTFMCNCKLDLKSKLKFMDYQAGARTWTMTNLENETCIRGLKQISCTLVVLYPEKLGRECEEKLVDSCSDDWLSEEEINGCSSYNYYVSNHEGAVFKNPDCAICNHVAEEHVKCLSGAKILRFGFSDSGMFKLSDLFSVNQQNCSEEQVFDFVYNECKTVEVVESKSWQIEVSNIIYIIFTTLSLIAILIHIAIYFILFKKRNLHATNSFSMVFSLFWAQLLLLICSQECNSVTMCYVSTVLIYYLFMSAFFWMNVMSYDICKTFHSTSIRDNSIRKYRVYALYAYGVPLIMAMIAVIVDLAARDAEVSPGFGDNGFWFANRGGLLLFFIGPTELLFLCNLIMLMISIYNIYQHQKQSRFARTNHKQFKKKSKEGRRSEVSDLVNPKIEAKNEESCKFGQIQEKVKAGFSDMAFHKERLILYSKLAVIVGAPWFFAIFTHLSVICDHIFNILNSLQGLLIFIAFDCKAKIWIDVCERLGFDSWAESISTETRQSFYSSRTRQSGLLSSSSGSGVPRGSTASKSSSRDRTSKTHL